AHPTLLQIFQEIISLSGASAPSDGVIGDLTAAISAVQTAVLPIEKTIDTLLTTLPAYDAAILIDQLEHGDLLHAIADPIAADAGLIPIALTIGVLAPLTTATEDVIGDLANLIGLPDLFPA